VLVAGSETIFRRALLARDQSQNFQPGLDRSKRAAMFGGDFFQILSAMKCLEQLLLLLGSPRLADVPRLLRPAARTRSSLFQSRTTRQHGSHDIGVL
jgi:hypothetical protein